MEALDARPLPAPVRLKGGTAGAVARCAVLRARVHAVHEVWNRLVHATAGAWVDARLLDLLTRNRRGTGVQIARIGALQPLRLGVQSTEREMCWLI